MRSRSGCGKARPWFHRDTVSGRVPRTFAISAMVRSPFSVMDCNFFAMTFMRTTPRKTVLAPHPVFACGARLRYVGSLERTPIVSDVAEGKAQQLQALAMASDSFSLIFIERSCLAETHDRICGRPHEPVNEFRCPQGGRNGGELCDLVHPLVQEMQT